MLPEVRRGFPPSGQTEPSAALALLTCALGCGSPQRAKAAGTSCRPFTQDVLSGVRRGSVVQWVVPRPPAGGTFIVSLSYPIFPIGIHSFNHFY